MLREAVCSILFLAVTFAQTPEAQSGPPRFEVAAIRPSNFKELGGPSGIETRRGLVRANNVTLKRTIAGAYGIGEYRILGGPAWAESDRFQIAAKADQPVGDELLNAMLQTLLAERFNLKLHRESRTGETFLLGIGKSGLKLQPASDAPLSYNNGHGHLEATGVTMREFVEILSRDLSLPVVDRTGLTGAYNFTLRWNADRPRIADSDDAAADRRFEMSTAIAEQLGLKLKSQRMPIEMLVIDHAEKPSEN
jgi:uncharacterized protein (TIGR03435 family)